MTAPLVGDCIKQRRECPADPTVFLLLYSKVQVIFRVNSVCVSCSILLNVTAILNLCVKQIKKHLVFYVVLRLYFKFVQS